MNSVVNIDFSNMDAFADMTFDHINTVEMSKESKKEIEATQAAWTKRPISMLSEFFQEDPTRISMPYTMRIKGKDYEVSPNNMYYVSATNTFYREWVEKRRVKKDLVKDTPKDLVEDTSKELVEDLVEDKSNNLVNNFAEDTPKDTPNDSVKESKEYSIKNIPDITNKTTLEVIEIFKKLDVSVFISDESLDSLTGMQEEEQIEHGNFYIDRFRPSGSIMPNVAEFYDDVKNKKYFDWYEKYDEYMEKYHISLFDFMSIRQYVYNQKLKVYVRKNAYYLSTIIVFTVDGVIHREHGPAYSQNNNEIVAYCKEGLIHSYDDRPAFLANSCQLHFWARNGKFYRDSPKPFYVGRCYGVIINDVKYWVYPDYTYEKFDWSDTVSDHYTINEG